MAREIGLAQRAHNGRGEIRPGGSTSKSQSQRFWPCGNVVQTRKFRFNDGTGDRRETDP